MVRFIKQYKYEQIINYGANLYNDFIVRTVYTSNRGLSCDSVILSVYEQL